jgi:ferritin
MEMEVLNHYKKFYNEADEEDCAVGIFLQQFVTIQVQAVGHYGDLLAKYKVAETTKEILEFDQHIADV